MPSTLVLSRFAPITTTTTTTISNNNNNNTKYHGSQPPKDGSTANLSNVVFIRSASYTGHWKTQYPHYSAVIRRVRKIATISFVMSVRLSVRMERIGSHWKDFYENLNIVRKICRENQVPLKPDKNDGNFT